MGLLVGVHLVNKGKYVMAIQQDIMGSRFGTLVPNAYIKFAYMSWSDANMKMTAVYSVWSSEQAKIDGLEVIDTIEVDMPGHMFANIQAEAYREIKALPRFTNAVDV